MPTLAALASVPAYAVIIYNFPCLKNRHRRKLFTGIGLEFLKTFILLTGHLVFVTQFLNAGFYRVKWALLVLLDWCAKVLKKKARGQVVQIFAQPARPIFCQPLFRFRF